MTNGQSGQFEDFFAEAEPLVRRVLVARHGSQRGREAAAEAFAWAFENQDRLITLKNPIAYLVRVGTSRTRPRRVAILYQPPQEPHALQDWDQDLARALRMLSPNQRASVVLTSAYGYSHAEVARILGIRPSTVNTHRRRGMAMLRRQLGALNE